ncbi:MAG: hypothetical protein KR126chlam1_00228 [Chlamydiae bacterium]|nr:hypothetical protein [Chlamydiota bacterium]
MQQTLDQISSILPSDFFSVEVDIPYVGKREAKDALKKKHLLPSFSGLLYEAAFAKVAAGWNEDLLVFDVTVEIPFEECFFPEYQKGDSIELFIDTRNLKSAGFPTRFCHHFVICPRPIEGVYAREVTSFRTDDRHELCDPERILVKGDFFRSRYFLKIVLPSDCLHGYDPSAFERLGFAYRINRKGEASQHFALSSRYHSIQQQPSLWSTIQLRKT